MNEYEIPQRCELHKGNYIDGYTIEKELGEGSFGIVYRVIDNNSSLFALKLLKLWQIVHDEDRISLQKRFKMEFDTGQIDSSYLVRSHAYGYVMGNPYIIMKYCPNGDLRQYLGCNLSKSTIDCIAHDILCGLSDLHKNGKAHRDIKPENVLFDEKHRALLTDFGISGDKNIRLTKRDIFGKNANVFGTYAYMPPEQLDRLRDATVLPTTDFFSFGVMMYEVFTNELPFGELTSDSELVNYIKNIKQGNWNRTRLEQLKIDSKWFNILEMCLHPNFKKRFQNTDEIISKVGYVKQRRHQESDREPSPKIVIDSGRIMLRIMQGEEYGQCYYLSKYIPEDKSGVITIGRMDYGINNTINILETESCYISRAHATIERNNQLKKWFIRDGQWRKDATGRGEWRPSTNGTFVNSKDATIGGCELKGGDIISMGDITLRVEYY